MCIRDSDSTKRLQAINKDIQSLAEKSAELPSDSSPDSQLMLGGGAGAGSGNGFAQGNGNGNSAGFEMEKRSEGEQSVANALAFSKTEIDEIAQQQIQLAELEQLKRGRGQAKMSASPNNIVGRSLTSSVGEVWFVNSWRKPGGVSLTMKNIESVLRENRISFSSTENTDSKVEAVYVVATAAQMENAIRSLSTQAQVTSFPVPVEDLVARDNEIAEPGSGASKKNLAKNAFASPTLGIASRASQIQRGVTLTPESSEIERFNEFRKHGKRADLPEPAEQEADEEDAPAPSAKDDDFAEEPSEWKKIEKSFEQDELQKTAAENMEEQEKSTKLERFLLLIQFED